ncbi:MAG: replicative DNA helicase [Bacteroidales bacterium]
MAKTNYPKKKQKVNIDNIGLDLAQVPPQAVDVEEAVLGALLVEPSVVPDVMESLIAECFYKEANREIFNAISTIASRHEPVDIFTVTEALKKSDKLDLVGGPAYLAELSSKVGGAAHIETHSKILLQKYIQRELITISYDIQKESFEDTVPVDDLLDEAQGKIFSLAERNMKRETQPIKEIIQNAITELEATQLRDDGLSGVPSGYTDLDKVTLGWQKSDLIILAARPAMGKTAFVLTMARNMTVEHKVPVAFFSLEMSSVQLVKRLMVSETGLSSQKIRGGIKMKDYEWVQLQEKLNALSEAPLYIDDTPSLSIYEFRSKARRMVQTAGVQLIIIDYLQLMTGPKELRGMREQEVSNISRSLKAIAKELNIPIIALSQLSRAVETRGGSKRPQLSDLRESGAIEQDADIVMFIHRPEYYGLVDDPQKQGLAEIIIAKHRNGSVQDVNMKFVPNEAKFVDANEMQFNSFPGDDGQMMESGMNSINDDLDGSNDFETQF